MKRNFLILPAFCLLLTFGCDADRRTGQSEGYQENGLPEDEYIEENEVERASAEVLGEETRQFVIEAALSSMIEVELGELAVENAQREEVKEFARMMVDNHRQLNERLQNTIEEYPTAMPEFLRAKQQEKLQELRNDVGPEFDQEYMDMVVEAHEEDIESFEKIRGEVQDTELQSWIDNSLNVLRQHLEQAKQIKEQLQNQ